MGSGLCAAGCCAATVQLPYVEESSAGPSEAKSSAEPASNGGETKASSEGRIPLTVLLLSEHHTHPCSWLCLVDPPELVSKGRSAVSLGVLCGFAIVLGPIDRTEHIWNDSFSAVQHPLPHLLCDFFVLSLVPTPEIAERDTSGPTG